MYSTIVYKHIHTYFSFRGKGKMEGGGGGPDAGIFAGDYP